jgi:hypothetical protein
LALRAYPIDDIQTGIEYEAREINGAMVMGASRCTGPRADTPATLTAFRLTALQTFSKGSTIALGS